MDHRLRRPLRGPLWRSAGRAVAAALVLAAAVAALGDAALRRGLPWLVAAIERVEPALKVTQAAVVGGAEGSRVRIQVQLARTVVVGGRAVVPHPQGHAFASIPAAQAWQGPLLLAALIAAWPARRRREWLLRIGAAALVLPMLMLLDLPVVAAAEFWRLLMQAHDPLGWQWLVAWADLLRGGGRAVLALLGGALVLRVAAWADGAKPGWAADPRLSNTARILAGR